MTFPNKHKKIFSVVLIIFLISGFFVWQANIVKAITPEEQAAINAAEAARDQDLREDGQAAQNTIAVSNAGKTSEPSAWNQQIPVLFHAIGGLFFLILKLLNGLVWLGANLADSILNITSFTSVNVVTIGWGITRDLANMFFALILLIMSISTILQIGGFTYKDILKRLVIAALLINFSLMFAGIIIDFAQVMTSYFLTAGAGGTGISANLTNGLKIVQVYNFNNTDQSIFQKMSEVMWGPTLQMIVEQFMAIILFMAAAFSFFAMSFFLIARIVWIWLLLIGAPLAWISFIIPNAPGQLGGLWNKWWQAFLKWTFFAPIYSFFLYLALTIAKNGIGLKSGNWGGGAASANALPLQSGFFAAPETILQYIVIIIILLAGLKVAQDMGITGAKTTMGWVESAGKWIGGKSKDYATRPGQWAYDSLANKAVQGLGKGASAIGLKKFGNRLEARGVQMEAEPAERERQKDYAKLLGSMSDQDLQFEINKAHGIKKLLAVRQAKERGLLEKDPTKNFDDTPESNKFTQAAKDFKESSYKEEDKKKPEYLAAKEEHEKYIAAKNKFEKEVNEPLLKQSKEVVQKSWSVLNSYGLKDDKGRTKEGRDLEDIAFDALPASEQSAIPAIIRRSKENGNLDKLKPRALRDEQAMNSIISELSPPEFTETFKKWGKKTKKAAEETMLKSFADMTNLTDKALEAEANKRERFAAVTDKIGHAFGPPGSLTLDPNKPENKKYIQKMAQYVSTMTAAKVADIRHEDKKGDLNFVGRYAKPDLVSNFGRERTASAEQKGFFRAGAIDSQLENKEEQAEAKRRLKGPGWSAFSGGEEEEEEEGAGVQPKQYKPKGINAARAKSRM